MGQRDGFSFLDIEKINRMYNCKDFSGQQPASGPSSIAGTGPVLFPINPPRPGNNFQGQRPGSGYQGQRPSGPGYGYGPSGFGGNYYPSGPGVYPSGPYYPYYEGEREEVIKDVSENVIEEWKPI